MKCKCKKEMMEIAYYKEDLFTHYSTMNVFWCKKCGRAVHVENRDYKKPIYVWYEPDSIPWQLKPKEPVRVEKEYGICEYKDCDRKATWEVCATNGRAAMRCGLHNTGEGLTLDMRKIEKIKVKK